MPGIPTPGFTYIPSTSTSKRISTSSTSTTSSNTKPLKTHKMHSSSASTSSTFTLPPNPSKRQSTQSIFSTTSNSSTFTRGSEKSGKKTGSGLLKRGKVEEAGAEKNVKTALLIALGVAGAYTMG